MSELERPVASVCMVARVDGQISRVSFQQALYELHATLSWRGDYAGTRYRVTIGPGRYQRASTFLHAYRIPTEPPC